MRFTACQLLQMREQLTVEAAELDAAAEEAASGDLDHLGDDIWLSA